MGYKIAVASLDGSNIDVSFGKTDKFYIYEVDGEEYHFREIRKVEENFLDTLQNCESDKVSEKNCGEGKINGCTSGCLGAKTNDEKILLVADCRCIICKKIGFNIRKQLEKRAITAFDIEIPIEQALKKIVPYFYKTDKHISLRDENSLKTTQREDYENE